MGDVIPINVVKTEKTSLSAVTKDGYIEITAEVHGSGDVSWRIDHPISGDRSALDEMITILTALRFRIDELTKDKSNDQ